MNISEVMEIKIMQQSLKLLRMAYMFPSKKELKLGRPIKSMIIKFFIINLSSIYFSVGAALHMAANIRNGIYDYIDKDLGNIISYHGCCYFLYRYILNVKYIVILYKQFSDFQTFGKPKNFDKRNQFLNKLSNIYIVYHTCVITFMLMSTLLYVSHCKEQNIEKNQKEVCGIPMPTWLPFDFDYFPLKQIVYLYQIYSVVIVYQTAGFLSFFMLATVEHLVLRFEHVRDTFVEALTVKNKQIRRQKFQKAVKYHNAVIEMGKIMNKCFSPCMMVHISLTAPVIGVAGYTFLTKIPLDTMGLLIGWTISTLVVCQGGQRLMDASLFVGTIMYRIDWYNLETDLQNDLVMVILRSRKPVFLRAGPFGPITYGTISTILKTSYSYVTLLKQTM